VKTMDDGTQDIVEAVAVSSRVDVVPTLLKVLCDITGMRVAVIDPLYCRHPASTLHPMRATFQRR